MSDVLEDIKARKPVIGGTGYWIDTDTMHAIIAEMEANRAANVVENVGGEAAHVEADVCENCAGQKHTDSGSTPCPVCNGTGLTSAVSLARKYDWISRQDDGLISAADVARDIRETFGIGAQHVGRADPIFDPAIISCDPYDERPGPYYDMKKVREIEAQTGIAFGVENRWAAYRGQIMWLRSENKRLREGMGEKLKAERERCVLVALDPSKWKHFLGDRATSNAIAAAIRDLTTEGE